MMGELIRPFKQSDRSAVREICYLTGMMGEPIEFLWPDKESFADMFTRYYTDLEPDSIFLAELDGKVVGYLTGCLDSQRAWNPLAIGAKAALKRGLIFKPVLSRTISNVVIKGIKALRANEIPTDIFKDPRWPAHLHINLLKEARGKNFGRALMQAWFDKLKKFKIPGCYLETTFENENAIAFFKKMGFEPYGKSHLIPGWHDRSGRQLHSLVMVKDL
jgi:ribosomal protein S18 acetylase RimI-like enzyme